MVGILLTQKENKVLLYTTAQAESHTIMLSERNHSKRIHTIWIPYYVKFQKFKLSDVKQISGCVEMGEEREGYEVSFRDDTYVLYLDGGVDGLWCIPISKLIKLYCLDFAVEFTCIIPK